jgi:hypothetical protein
MFLACMHGKLSKLYEGKASGSTTGIHAQM